MFNPQKAGPAPSPTLPSKFSTGTLQSVKSHKKNEVFENLSDADITSLVNFTLLKDYFLKQNFLESH